jgi:hypothetical protein
MFEDNKQQGGVPNDLPTEPADIFAGVEDNKQPGLVPTDNGDVTPDTKQPDDALSAGHLQPKTAAQPSPQPADPVAVMVDPSSKAGSLNQVAQYKMKEPILGKIIFIVLFVVIVGALLLGGWFVYAKILNKDKTIKTLETVTTTIKAGFNKEDSDYGMVNNPVNANVGFNTNTTEVVDQQKNDTILFGEPVDTDSDGLDDIREKQLGTDITKKDTDLDGLSDGDEVLIWKTKPLIKDTDGDGYIDGVEIKNGYNPLGPGKLYNIPKIQPATSTN